MTDVHHAVERVDQLKSWLAARNLQLDVVLISGDVADSPMDWSLTADQQAEHQRNLETTVDSLIQVKGQVYFIPGNVKFFFQKSVSPFLLLYSTQHDALTMFKVTEGSPAVIPSPPPFPCNMHLKRTTIAPNLHLLGIGGSVPGYQAGEMIWEGFPYKDYSEMDADVHKLLDPVFFEDTNSLAANDAVILMTHVGPAESGLYTVHYVCLFMINAVLSLCHRHLVCPRGSKESDSLWKQRTHEAPLH